MFASPFKRLVLPGTAALCALGTLAIPHSASAAPGDPVGSLPTAEVTRIAQKYHQPVSEVLARQQKLAPIIKELTPSLTQPSLKSKLAVSKIAKAPVDECFVAIGQDGPAPDANGNCPVGSKPKRNEGYVFGSTRAGDYMYYGTLNNAACSAGVGYGINPPEFANDKLVCEGNRGWANRHLGWKMMGDTHRQSIYRINADTNKLENISPTDEQAPAFKYNVGIRGQGALDDVVLMAGPTLNSTGTGYAGVEFLAYEGGTGKFLGETLLPQYSNIRRGNVIDGDLYFGVRLAGTGSGSGGAIVKWTGSKADPFKFEVVAQGLASEPAYLTEYNDHIVTAGWTAMAGGKAVGAMPEMYMSPKLPAGGLTNATADASNWKSIFKASDYDPDPVLARQTQFGDLVEYNGKLVFSTYYYNGFGTLNAFNYYGRPDTEVDRLATYLNAERAAAIFEMDNVGQPNQKVRMLYGEAKLPTYNTLSKKWELKSNKLNQVAKYGPAGFGNRFNSYSWMWEKYKGSLYMSTFDASSLLNGAAEMMAGPVLGLSDETKDLLQPVLTLNWRVTGGGDVWRFDDLNRPALPETLDAFGNKNAQGVRGWTAFPEKNKLMAGMATWANLDNSAKNSGGWEVNQLKG